MFRNWQKSWRLGRTGRAPQAIAALGQLPCKGRLLRGQSPRERLPFQGRWPRSRPEGLCRARRGADVYGVRSCFAAGFPHFNKPCLSCYFVGLHWVFHSFNMVFHISTVERCRKPVQNVEKARRSPPRRDFLRFVQSCFTRCSFFGSML